MHNEFDRADAERTAPVADANAAASQLVCLAAADLTKVNRTDIAIKCFHGKDRALQRVLQIRWSHISLEALTALSASP
jgi:hypothetical protein